MKSNLLEVINGYAKGALRTICFAYKDLRPHDGGITHEDDDQDGVIKAIEKENFILLCIIGIKDIIREEVPKAVRQCQMAGITVRMVTGDNKTTATAIAKECGILYGDIEHEGMVMEGPEFYEKLGGLICKNAGCKKEVAKCECGPDKITEGVRNEEYFKTIHKKLRVLARSRPEDKYLLVTALKE